MRVNKFKFRIEYRGFENKQCFQEGVVNADNREHALDILHKHMKEFPDARLVQCTLQGYGYPYPVETT